MEAEKEKTPVIGGFIYSDRVTEMTLAFIKEGWKFVLDYGYSPLLQKGQSMKLIHESGNHFEYTTSK